MLLAEDLLLLVTDDGSGQLTVPAAQVDPGLGGANLPRPYGLSRRQLAARAEEIAQGDWASGAVRKAIDEMNAAVIAATTAATIAASG
jgi:hypothetical protein